MAFWTAAVVGLAIGPMARSHFRDEATRRAEYFKHREAIAALIGPPDPRGWGWVTYEGGGFLPHEGGRIDARLHRPRPPEINEQSEGGAGVDDIHERNRDRTTGDLRGGKPGGGQDIVRAVAEHAAIAANICAERADLVMARTIE